MTQPRLLDRVRAEIRTRHYSYRTEQAYVLWVKKVIRFNELRHPLQLGESEISTFLSHLAVERKVAASTQNQALSAILFLYRRVLKRELACVLLGDSLLNSTLDSTERKSGLIRNTYTVLGIRAVPGIRVRPGTTARKSF